MPKWFAVFIFIIGAGIVTGVLVFILFPKPCCIEPDELSMLPKEHVEFQTSDEVTIIGNYFASSLPDSPAVLLLHMMPAAKESWDGFTQKLAKSGFRVLAIDLRGHGESNQISNIKNQKLNYKEFTDEEHQASKQDVEAAREWLIQKGVVPEKIFLGGASIGANLALQYLREHPEAPAAFLLSPGLDYRSIKTDVLMEGLNSSQRVFLVASEDDEYSAQTVRALYGMGSAEKNLKMYESGGHGTTLFESHAELMDEIIHWMK